MYCDSAAEASVKIACSAEDTRRVDRRIGDAERAFIRREKMKEPRMKLRIDVPDLIHRVGWEYGWPVIPSPT